MGKALFHGVLEANTMAAHLGLSRFYFKFREEFYGIAGGKPRAAKATQMSQANGYRQHNAEDQKALRKSIDADPSNGMMLEAFAGKPASTHSFTPTLKLRLPPKEHMPVQPTRTKRYAKVRIGEPWGIEVEIDPVRGAVVTKVDPGSVAARVNIPVGAAFIAINGNATPTMTKQEALTVIRRHSALDLTFHVPPEITPWMVGAWPDSSPRLVFRGGCSGNKRRSTDGVPRALWEVDRTITMLARWARPGGRKGVLLTTNTHAPPFNFPMGVRRLGCPPPHQAAGGSCNTHSEVQRNSWVADLRDRGRR